DDEVYLMSALVHGDFRLVALRIHVGNAQGKPDQRGNLHAGFLELRTGEFNVRARDAHSAQEMLARLLAEMLDIRAGGVGLEARNPGSGPGLLRRRLSWQINGRRPACPGSSRAALWEQITSATVRKPATFPP